MGDLEPVSILLVDDRRENLISLAAILERPEYELVAAESGQDALRRLMEREFAVILLDVQMPTMDGFETAAFIKQRAKTRHVPIIFISALSRDEPLVYKGYGAGAVDYLVKPFEPAILRSKVAVFAELYRKTQELKRHAEIIRQNEVAQIELESLKREQAANQRYRELVDGITDGIVWTANPETGAFTFVSAQAEVISGYSIQEWLSGAQFWEGKLHPEERDATLEKLRAGLQETSQASLEHRFIRADGEVLWFHTGVWYGDCAGTPEIRGLSINVTHLKNAEERAKHSIRMRDEFLQIASHELKTPLTSLSLRLETLRRLGKKGFPGEKVLELLPSATDSIHRQLDRLNKLVEELLDVSRISAGKLHLERETMNLNELVHEMSERFAQQFQETNGQLELKLDEAVQGEWDRLRIEQVFNNLISNALRYGANKPVRVELLNDGEFGVLRVIDQGIGIAPENHEKVFERFERAVSPGHFGGLGLGLYIVKQIVTAHGGTITVTSEIGKGSTFEVRLPFKAPEQEQELPTGLFTDSESLTSKRPNERQLS